jgi:hypothetical protein
MTFLHQKSAEIPTFDLKINQYHPQKNQKSNPKKGNLAESSTTLKPRLIDLDF